MARQVLVVRQSWLHAKQANATAMPRARGAGSYCDEVIGAKWSTPREPQSWLIIITLKKQQQQLLLHPFSSLFSGQPG